MRFTWLSLGLATSLFAIPLLSGCKITETSSSGGGGSSTTTTGGNSTGGTTGGGGSTGGTTGGGGSTGGTTGGGGTGGATIPANDECPGELVTLALDTPVTLNGTLVGATDNYNTFCADDKPEPTAPDVVYQLDLADDATVTLQLDATGFVPALSFRKTQCDNRVNGDTCLDLGTGSITQVLALPPGTYWVVIDSADDNVGSFSLQVTAATPKCGDGVVNPGEQCDPAVVSNDDGCINPTKVDECKYGEPPPDPAIVACPGGLITVAKGDSFQLGPYNNGSGMHNETNIVDATDCVSAAVGPEDVFHITPTENGTLTAQIGYDENGTTLYCDAHVNDCGDFVMYLRKNMCDSADAADQMACTDYTLNPNSPFGFDEVLTITQPVTGGSDYWLVVDGLDDSFGIGGYYLQISLQ